MYVCIRGTLCNVLCSNAVKEKEKVKEKNILGQSKVLVLNLKRFSIKKSTPITIKYAIVTRKPLRLSNSKSQPKSE